MGERSLVCYATRMPQASLIDTDVASDDAVALIMAIGRHMVFEEQPAVLLRNDGGDVFTTNRSPARNSCGSSANA